MNIAPTETRPGIRQRAEEKARLDGVSVSKSLSLEEAQKLIHELQVYQIELEMQNDELRLKQDELDAAHIQAALASVVENSDNIIVCKDIDLRVVATNMAFAQASGHALKQLEEDRRSYILDLVEVIEQERFRTARELHDDLGQRLTILSFAISQLKQNHLDRKGSSHILLEMQTGVDGMMESLRRICTNLRPALLDELGLSAALKWVAKDFTHYSGIPCRITFNGECCNGNVECAMTIFRIVQESLNNTVKHAGASSADISLSRINGSVCVQICDDGCGTKSDKRSASPSLTRCPKSVYFSACYGSK